LYKITSLHFEDHSPRLGIKESVNRIVKVHILFLFSIELYNILNIKTYNNRNTISNMIITTSFLVHRLRRDLRVPVAECTFPLSLFLQKCRQYVQSIFLSINNMENKRYPGA